MQSWRVQQGSTFHIADGIAEYDIPRSVEGNAVISLSFIRDWRKMEDVPQNKWSGNPWAPAFLMTISFVFDKSDAKDQGIDWCKYDKNYISRENWMSVSKS